jgi:opacity protein-like surface antigen
MAGFAFDITDHLAVDVGYRYINFGTFSGVASNLNGGAVIKENQTSQDVKVGLRYSVD